MVQRIGKPRGLKKRKYSRGELTGVTIGEGYCRADKAFRARVDLKKFFSLADEYFKDRKVPKAERTDAENALALVLPILSGETTVEARAKYFRLTLKEMRVIISKVTQEIIPKIKSYSKQEIF